jgi:selenoprotein B, glycine/betaine/sarcosine/D-proline reductase family
MVKGIERYGIPVVHMATVVPISLTIGANRIIPGVGIPYPLGDPTQGEADSKKIREKMVRRALKTLQTPVSEQTVFETDNF